MFQFRRFPTYAYGFCICYMDISPCFFFFNDTATTEIYTLVDTLSLHDALPISLSSYFTGHYDQHWVGFRKARMLSVCEIGRQ